jgi:hypothetical protein
MTAIRSRPQDDDGYVPMASTPQDATIAACS